MESLEVCTDLGSRRDLNSLEDLGSKKVRKCEEPVELRKLKKLGSLDSFVILESCGWSYNHGYEVSRRVIRKEEFRVLKSWELCRVVSVQGLGSG